jgi:hypothetical protein
MTKRQWPWSCYTLCTGNKVYLTSRPDRYLDKDSQTTRTLFYDEFHDTPDIRIYFTDDLIEGPEYNVWVPWFVDDDKREGDNPTLSSIATAVSLIKQYDVRGFRSSIWLHCDSSAMRAPTFFGLFLHAFYPDQTDEILKTRTTNMSENYHWSSPKEYAKIDLERDPKVQVVLDQIKEKYGND